jgi:hypothetical protein
VDGRAAELDDEQQPNLGVLLLDERGSGTGADSPARRQFRLVLSERHTLSPNTLAWIPVAGLPAVAAKAIVGSAPRCLAVGDVARQCPP